MSVEISYADKLSTALIDQNPDLRTLVQSVIAGEVAQAINRAVIGCLSGDHVDYMAMANAVQVAIPYVESGPFIENVNRDRAFLRSKMDSELMHRISEQGAYVF